MIVSVDQKWDYALGMIKVDVSHDFPSGRKKGISSIQIIFA